MILTEKNLGDVGIAILTSDCEQKLSNAPIQFGSVSNSILTNKKRKQEFSDTSKISGSASTTVHASNCVQNPSCATFQLPNGIFTEGRPIAGVDWSRSEVIVNTGSGVIQRFKTLSEAAKCFTGYIWVMESTADSFELQNRQVDLDAIKANNIRAYCFNSKYTSQYRIKWNDIAKTDEADSEVIRRIFTETKITCAIFRQIDEEDKLRETIKKVIVEDRQFEGANSVALAKKYLPKFENVPKNLHEFLYKPETIKSKKPKNVTPKKQIGRLLMAAEKVREAGFGWRTFRRQVGNYGQGYGCMLRSEYYWWLVRIIVTARMKKSGIGKTIKKSHIDPKTKEEKGVRIWTRQEEDIKKTVMKDMDNVLKWLWKLTV